MDEQGFWAIIDEAWKSDPELQAFREAVLVTIDSPERREAFEEQYGEDEPTIPDEDTLLGAVQVKLNSLSAEELQQFDVILERKLYDIDRQEIHEHTDGSDDGFLYCRGFIVAMGQAYYTAVDRQPSNAMCDWECEAMTYLSWHLYNQKFGEMPKSGISRETGSNPQGWAE